MVYVAVGKVTPLKQRVPFVNAAIFNPGKDEIAEHPCQVEENVLAEEASIFPKVFSKVQSLHAFEKLVAELVSIDGKLVNEEHALQALEKYKTSWVLAVDESEAVIVIFAHP